MERSGRRGCFYSIGRTVYEWGLARVVRRHLLPETAGMRGAKSEDGSCGLRESGAS